MKLIQDIAEYRLVMEFLHKIKAGKKRVIIAIDGRAGSGKTTFAKRVQEALDCNVFHMDDFFLPASLKTEKRLQEPGGNVHYERFYEEVIAPIVKGMPVVYRPYNCQTGELEEEMSFKPKQITVVEGVYSLHPLFQPFYDFKVFMTVDQEVQLARIERRNGKEMLQDFVERWIPLEENYFRQLNIEKQCDITIDTTDF